LIREGEGETAAAAQIGVPIDVVWDAFCRDPYFVQAIQEAHMIHRELITFDLYRRAFNGQSPRSSPRSL
jgi:hypothetical protein